MFAGSKKDGIFRFLVSFIVFFCLIGFAVSGDILAVDKPLVGAIEHVIIEPFGFRVDARIDTGASAKSLDALGISKHQKTR